MGKMKTFFPSLKLLLTVRKYNRGVFDMNEKKYFDINNNRLVYIGSKSDNEYWDNHWDNDKFEKNIKNSRNFLVSNTTKKYLPKGSEILEGGCGIGQNVYLIEKQGYKCTGLDYAQKTVDKIKELVPDMDVRLGDVRNLEFKDNSFDGYWSLGVIEHFYNGYGEIINEMNRVIKKDGILFLTVPSMSWLREYKAKNNKYPVWIESEENIENFYQFALNPKKVIKDFEDIGFELLEQKPYDGFKGLKDEIRFLKKPMQFMYDSDFIILKVIRKIIDFFIKNFTSHMTLFVFRKL